MGWVSREKAVNLAALIFLAFAFLWLAIAATGASGVSLADGAEITSLIQGLCALAAACLLVSRVTVAPVLVLCLSGGILLAPGLAQALGERSQARAHSQLEQAAADQSAIQLALPDPLRSEEGKLLAMAAHQQGYQDPLPLQQELQERQQRVGEWINTHTSEVSRILGALAHRGLPPQELMAARVTAGLAKYKGGTDWTWLETFLQKAREQGLDDSSHPLTAEQTRQAQEQARQWLLAHPNPTAMQPYENKNAPPDPEQQFAQTKRSAVSFMALGVLLPALWAMAKGMGSFVRPWDPLRAPGWVVEGLRLLLRQKNGLPHPQAPFRVAGGLVILVAGVILAALLRGRGLPGAKAVTILAVAAGGGLLVAGLNLNEEPTQ